MCELRPSRTHGPGVGAVSLFLAALFPGLASPSWAELLVNEVLYDPDAPARSALARREATPALAVVGLGGVALLLGLLLFAAHVSRRRTYRRLLELERAG